MCGRFAFYLAPADLKRLFGVENLINFPARYNAAPMQDHVLVIRGRMGMARWGFLPPWAAGDDRALAAKMINARSETVQEKPSFRDAWAKGRRCLVPACGFYEWYGPEKQTVPYYICRRQDRPMAMAGLWGKTGDILTFAILTREATGPVSQYHHRMPVIFDPAQAQQWFSCDAGAAWTMMRADSHDDLECRVVGPDVGKVANDHPGLITEQEAAPKKSGTARLV